MGHFPWLAVALQRRMAKAAPIASSSSAAKAIDNFDVAASLSFLATPHLLSRRSFAKEEGEVGSNCVTASPDTNWARHKASAAHRQTAGLFDHKPLMIRCTGIVG